MRNRAFSDLKQSDSHEELRKLVFGYEHNPRTAVDIVLEGTEVADSTISAIHRLFIATANLLAALGHSIPYVGGILSLLALIPKAMATLLDKNKSTKEKIISGVLLTVLGGLAITALVLGAKVALIIGAIGVGLNGAMESLGLVKNLLARKKLNARISLRAKFEKGLNDKELEHMKEDFNELIALSCIESDYNVKHKIFDPNNEYLHYLVKSKKIKIDAPPYPYPSISQLQELYLNKEMYTEQLKEKFKKLEGSIDKESKESLLNEIHSIKIKLGENQNKILELTKNKSALIEERNKLDSKISLSAASVGIAGVSCLLSVAAVVLMLGLIAAPPVALIVVASLAIITTVVGILKFAAEKYIEHENKKKDESKQIESENSLLEHAFNKYSFEHTIQNAIEKPSEPMSIPGPSRTEESSEKKENDNPSYDDELEQQPIEKDDTQFVID